MSAYEGAAAPARIVAVDDEPVNLLVVEGYLHPHGYDVRTAEDGPSGLALIRSAHPDVVLLDVMMPGMTGLEVCEQLKNDPATAGIPIVLLTALDAKEHRKNGLIVGADEFLMKPIDEAELLARVRAFTARTSIRAPGRTYSDVSADDLESLVLGFADHLELDASQRAVLGSCVHHHEVNRVRIPDHVLLNRDALNQGEAALMRMHTGAQATGDASEVGDILTAHHEHWDGCGRPGKAKGSDIPKLARVLAVADVYATVARSDGPEAGLQQVEREAGQVLDPELAGLFATWMGAAA